MPSVQGLSRGRLAGAAATVGFLAVLMWAWAVAGRGRAPEEPPDGKHSALIQVDPRTSIYGDEDTSSLEARAAQFAKVHCQLIKSSSVLSRASASLTADHPALVAGKVDLIAWLKAEIRAEVLPDSCLITISMPGGRLADQAPIVNAVAQAYLAEERIYEETLSMHHRQQLENTQDAYRKDLNRQRKELREAEANGLSQEQIDTLKDEIAVREQVFRKLGLAVEERRLERQLIPRVHLLQLAFPS